MRQTWMPAALWITLQLAGPVSLPAATDAGLQGWRLHTNERFGFSVQYPKDWRLGDSMPDGIGVTLYPPAKDNQIALSGFMNLMEGKSQDGRQTLDEFAAAHRRIITQLYGKRKIEIIWENDQETTLAGLPAKRLSFTYQDDRRNAMQELHIFSLGRNEGRGVRIKLPAARSRDLMPTITRMLETYRPGRDQNAVSPIGPKGQN
ncbi:MAG: hypothetical protein NW701_06855 [Nitrospira sp.]